MASAITSPSRPATPASNAIEPGPAPQSADIPPEAQEELAAKVRKVSKEWVSQVAQMQQLDFTFAARLAACTRPSDAAEVCGRWMAHRIDSAVAAQHHFLELWLDTVTEADSRRVAARLGMTDPPRAGHADVSAGQVEPTAPSSGARNPSQRRGEIERSDDGRA